ncbi:MAG: type IV secretory system conjugative DNA transfer family protein [Clostridiales bacterium]|nr:type IV secretory system conjugative DNA transfer family protein [Clostridiales bacterium]
MNAADRGAKLARFLKAGALPYLPYAFIFWLANKLGAAYRLAPGADFLKKLTGCVRLINAVMADPPSLVLFDLIVGFAGAALVFGIVSAKKRNARKYRKDVEYGSARWGKPEDIVPFMDADRENNIILTQSEGLTMNPRPANPKFARNKNLLVVGGSGSGKTRYVLKPNIMQCRSKDFPVSFVITDPKAELLRDTGKMLERHGYTIKVLNTIDFTQSHRYNPFAYIHSEKDILKLVTTLMANTRGDQKGGDPFWERAETLLYTALIGYLHYVSPPAEHSFSTLAQMISMMEVHEDDESFQNVVDMLFESLADIEPEHFALRQYSKFKLAAGKTLKSILVACGARLAPFDIAEVREVTSTDELQLDTLGDRKTALFIVMSDTDTSFNFLVSMCCTQLFNILCEKADSLPSGRLPIHVRCLIDEAANIGQIPNLEKLMATIRSREISACVVLQAMSQLKALYRDNADTIAGNCDAALFLGGKEKSTLEEWSKLLGRETIDTFSNSETKGNSPSFGKNFQKLGKDLMTIDELAVMDGGLCILQLRGVRPFLSRKFDILKHPLYRHLGDFDKRNAFDVKRLLGSRLKVKPSDAFDVYDIELPDAPPEAFENRKPSNPKVQKGAV